MVVDVPWCPTGDHYDVGGLHRFIAVGCGNGEAILRGNDARLFGAQLHLKALFAATLSLKIMHGTEK